MTQRDLRLWDTDDFITYSEIEAFRLRAYARRGPALVATLRDAINDYAHDEDPERLSVINQAVLDLAALNPEWFEFSVEVFKTYVLTPQTPPKLLQGLFESTLRQFDKKVA